MLYSDVNIITEQGQLKKEGYKSRNDNDVFCQS